MKTVIISGFEGSGEGEIYVEQKVGYCNSTKVVLLCKEVLEKEKSAAK